MRLLRNSFFILCVVTFFTTHLNGQYVWVRKLSGAAFSVSYNPRNHNTIYRGGSNNVSVSYDAGQTWQSLPSAPSLGWIRFVGINPSDTAMLFIGGDFGGLWRSTDAGNSWNVVKSNVGFDGESIAIDPVSPNRMYLGTYGSGFHRSTDSGTTWTLSPGTAGSFYCTVAIRPDSTNILYVGSGNGSISKSTDYGLTWRVVHAAVDSLFSETPKIVVDPQSPVIAYATHFGGLGGIWKTVNGGETWFQSGLDSIQVWSLDVDATHPSDIFTGTFSNAILYRSTDSGQSWSNYSFGLPGSGDHWMVKILPTDTAAYLALSGGVYKLQRGAGILTYPSQLIFPAGRGGDIVSAFFYVQNNEDTVRVDSIKGTRFTFTFNPPTPIYPPNSYDSIRAALALPTTLGTYYDTISVWSRDLVGNPYQFPSRIQVSPEFTVSPSELLFPVRRGGDTVRAYFYVKNVLDTVRVDSMRGIRYGYTFEPSRPTFYPSVNDSVLVTVVLPPTPGYVRDTILIWSSDLRVNPFRVGTRLRILTGVETGPQQPETYQLHQNFPNPFNPVTLITYDLPKQSFVRLTISNVLGEEISVLYQGVRVAGRYSAEFNAAGLSSGVYFYRLEASPKDGGRDGFLAVRKMLVIK